MDRQGISFKDVKKPHEDLIKSFQIPEWIIKQKCTKCGEELGYLSLRSIGLKLNAQHIGNFFVEVCCQHCQNGYELHIRSICKNIEDFINMLKTNYQMSVIKFEPDYSITYDENNLVKNIIQKENYGNKKA